MYVRKYNMIFHPINHRSTSLMTVFYSISSKVKIMVEYYSAFSILRNLYPLHILFQNHEYLQKISEEFSYLSIKYIHKCYNKVKEIGMQYGIESWS